jgi:hypothetical protein
MNLTIDSTPAPGSKYLSTVMSLVCRWPPFDFVTHSKYFYQRIKSENIMKASLISKATGAQAKTPAPTSDIFILPTDDERLKIVIIPLDCLKHKAEEGSLPF